MPCNVLATCALVSFVIQIARLLFKIPITESLRDTRSESTEGEYFIVKVHVWLSWNMREPSMQISDPLSALPHLLSFRKNIRGLRRGCLDSGTV